MAPKSRPHAEKPVFAKAGRWHLWVREARRYGSKARPKHAGAGFQSVASVANGYDP